METSESLNSISSSDDMVEFKIYFNGCIENAKYCLSPFGSLYKENDSNGFGSLMERQDKVLKFVFFIKNHKKI